MKKILFLLFLLFFPTIIFAQEQIDNFDVVIKINEDASVEVTEKIDYDFGEVNKHGIYREIPYKYDARGGNYKLILENIDVKDEKENSYNFEVLNNGNNKNIKIGDADKFVNGKKIYVINYQVKRAINFFDDYDELYWNVTGNDWQVPILNSKIKIVLPENIKKDFFQYDCFVGVKNSTEKCLKQDLEYDINGNVAGIIFSNNELEKGEGLTFVVSIPKGLIIKPSFSENFLYILKDNLILFLPFIVFLILFYVWKKRGKDPKGKGVIIAQFEAPDDLTPAQVGALVDESADKTDISAEIINLAIKGFIKINKQEKKVFLFRSDEYIFEKLKNDEKEELKEHELYLLKKLFEEKENIKLSELKNSFYQDFEEIKKKIFQSLTEKKYFAENPNIVKLKYILGGFSIMILLIIIFGSFGFINGSFSIISIILSFGLIIIFSLIMPQKTEKGVLIKEHILGLKKYMEVAEADRINFHNAPERNPQHFERLLPYAMVLGVEKQWAKQFEGIYNQEPSWYSGVGTFNSILLANSLNSFGSELSSAVSPQASSGGSGFSGGGSSGGFGGGGGGSW